MTQRKTRILVVDDDADVLDVLAETLAAFGYAVVKASGGEDALRVLISRDDIGMMITDMRMPGMSGLDLAAAARRVKSGLRVLVISGYFMPQQLGLRFLKKPFHMADLASAVSAELA